MPNPEFESEHTLTDDFAAMARQYIDELDDDTPFSALIRKRTYQRQKDVPEPLIPWHDEFYSKLEPDELGQINKLLSMLARIQRKTEDSTPIRQWGLPVSNTLGEFRAMTVEKFQKRYKIPKHYAGKETFTFLVNAGFFKKSE